MTKTNREKAEAAKEALIEEEGWSKFSIHLCPACNEPEFADDVDPNMFADADRTAFQISPAKIAESDHPNPWDRICVTAEKVELDDGETLRMKPHMHDYTMDVYEEWQEKVDEIDTIERRKSENKGLGDFA